MGAPAQALQVKLSASRAEAIKFILTHKIPADRFAS